MLTHMFYVTLDIVGAWLFSFGQQAQLGQKGLIIFCLNEHNLV